MNTILGYDTKNIRLGVSSAVGSVTGLELRSSFLIVLDDAEPGVVGAAVNGLGCAAGLAAASGNFPGAPPVGGRTSAMASFSQDEVTANEDAQRTGWPNS